MKMHCQSAALLVCLSVLPVSPDCRAQETDAAAPVVVKTVPENGSNDVAPGAFEIKVTFSKDMQDGTWAWCRAEEHLFPKTLGQPHYEADKRTCVLPVQLEPGCTYACWIGLAEFPGFKDTKQHPATPYLLTFHTRDDPPAPGRAARWSEDLDFLDKEFPQRHKDFGKLIPPARFHAEVAALKLNVTNLSDERMVLGLTRLIAGMGVAHTSINWGAFGHGFSFSPLKLRWFSDGLMVVGAPEKYRDASGWRVMRIGALTTGQLEGKVADYIPHENQAWLREEEPAWLGNVQLLQEVKAIGPDGVIEYELASADGKTRVLRLSAEDGGAGNRINVMDALNIPRPLYLQNPKKDYWRQWLPESRTLYFQYNRCAEDPGQPFSKVAADTIAFAASNSAARFVVDLRANSGGNSDVVMPLLKGLQENPSLSGRGHLYVLIGPRTFSSGMMDAIFFRDRLHAILVGEPTGGKPNGYGEIEKLTLPNSHLEVFYSVKYFRQIPDGDPASLDSDILVPLTMKDFLAGRDPVLEAVLKP